jgi:RNA polymerase sigma factor (sigma-70 family)
MSVDYAYLQDHGMSKCPTVEESRPAREKELLAAAKLGRGAAFDELCQPYAKRLLPTIQLFTRNREDAEDALQDCFLRAFVHIKDFDGRSKFSTWLTRIAINCALMILRRRRNSFELSLSETTERVLGVSDHLPNPEMRCVQREREKVLRRAVGRLRPGFQRVIQLGQFEERSVKETAQILDITISATKARLYHARAALRRSAALRAVSRTRNEPAA